LAWSKEKEGEAARTGRFESRKGACTHTEQHQVPRHHRVPRIKSEKSGENKPKKQKGRREKGGGKKNGSGGRGAENSAGLVKGEQGKGEKVANEKQGKRKERP